MENNNKSSLFANLNTEKKELSKTQDSIISLFQSVSTIPQNSTIKFFNAKTGVFYKVRGRHAQTLYWLLYHRYDGITPISVCNTAWRLANYVFYLRRTCKLDIQTEKEPHVGGYHARYFLLSDVTVLEITYNNIVYSVEKGA